MEHRRSVLVGAVLAGVVLIGVVYLLSTRPQKTDLAGILPESSAEPEILQVGGLPVT